jgi:hypothetical protein
MGVSRDEALGALPLLVLGVSAWNRNRYLYGHGPDRWYRASRAQLLVLTVLTPAYLLSEWTLALQVSRRALGFVLATALAKGLLLFASRVVLLNDAVCVRRGQLPALFLELWIAMLWVASDYLRYSGGERGGGCEPQASAAT